jgi:hypothetical protein
MAVFLTTHAAAARIEEIITEARKKIILLSPYLQLSPLFGDRLLDAAKRHVPITIVYGKSALQSDQYGFLSTLPGLRLLFLERLHAKCYLNEQRMVITSMNMYEFSEKHNREMGILLERNDSAYEAALNEVQSIISAAAPDADQSPRVFGEGPFRAQPHRRGHGRGGVCIRCSRSIAFDPSRPLCADDYQVWATFGNEDYPEAFCHKCGQPAETSMRRPLCYACFASTSSF